MSTATLDESPFVRAGFSRIDISDAALDAVSATLQAAGVPVRDFDLAPLAERFARHMELPAYQGDYRAYGGGVELTRIHKALEHFVSFEAGPPAAGLVAVDVGSCRSVVPLLLLEEYGCFCYAQDLTYPAGIRGNKIGSSADALPLANRSVDRIYLHCTFEHFEGQADAGFIKECARVLRPGGQVVILPLYLNSTYANITGEQDAKRRGQITFDREAEHFSIIPEWDNRFGRHYSAAALLSRVIEPARAAGLRFTLHRIRNWEVIHPGIWLRWMLVLEPGAR